MDDINDQTCIGKLAFSTRTKNCLRFSGIKNLGDLMSYTDKALLKICNLGKHSLKEINIFREEYKNNRIEKDAPVGFEKDFLSTMRSFFKEQISELFLELSEKIKANELDLIKTHEMADCIQYEVRELNEKSHSNNITLERRVNEIEAKWISLLSVERTEETLFAAVKDRINAHYYVIQKAFNDYVQSKASEDKDHLSNKISILESKIAELESRIASLFFAGEK